MNNRLIKFLVSCEELLEAVNEKFWLNKIKVVIGKASNDWDVKLLDEIISWYGGMGSFNDLIICNSNGHILKKEDEKRVNNKLSEIRTHIYQVAMNLKKEN